MESIAISMVVALVVVAVVYWFLSQNTPASSLTIQSTIEDGKKTFTSKKDLPRSFDQKEGIAFSYTCWVKIDDFAYRYGQPKVIFTKGSTDLKTMCPALLVDSNTNSLLVKLDTFGGTETIPISNIPAKKWLHIALAIDQDSVNIYVNGTLYLHHSLMQVPKQNASTVSTGIGGGFDGKISNLEYYSYLLSPENVQAAMASTPQPDPSEKGVGILPPYFDMSWWTGRR
jgi:hypothetical protein